jgi:uncharacterized membrane protein YphA (DoxX/SURF4 family)
MQNNTMSYWMYKIGRWILGIIFFYSGGAKLIDPQSFAVIIDAFGLIPEVLIAPIALGIPALEILVAFGLLFDIRGALAVTTVLIVLFMAILGYAIYMGLDIDCGCFGPDDPEADAFHGLRLALCRDAVIMIGIIFLYVWRLKKAVKPKNLKLVFNNHVNQKGGIINAND